MKKLFYLFALVLSNSLLVKAQQSFKADRPLNKINHLPPSQSGRLVCGIADLTPAQALSLTQEANLALQRKRRSKAAFADITYVPIRPHIVRRSDGTGGLSLAGLNKMLAYANSHYLLNGFGIQFYFAGTTPDYIDSDQLYAGFPYGEGSAIDGRDATNAMNQYYVYQFSANIGGYAYYPFDGIASTRSFIGIGDGSQPFIDGNRTVAHELGHNFGLLHTHGPANDVPTDELVTRGAGANCETRTTNGITVLGAGDDICDTPADPFYVAGTNIISVNGCTQYDPNSAARDANGDPYTPMVTNIMSYWSNYCTFDFTPGQYERMQAGLALRQTHTSYSLDAPATNVNPPTHLAASSNGFSVVLTWQDNADNEMGYFIERSTSPNEGFLPIGGVAPEITSFTDEQVTTGTQYYYRIRPSNTTTDNLSSTLAVGVCPSLHYLVTRPGRTSAQLYWSSQTAQTGTLRWRALGDDLWTTVNAITSVPYSLTGLNGQTAYEWQVRGNCSPTVSSAFSDIQSFTTISCQIPYSIYTTAVGSESVQLIWYSSTDDPGRTAEIRYRILGNPVWITLSGLPSPSTEARYTLTGLLSNTTYEWQVRSICSASESSGFTSSTYFRTMPPSPDLTPILYARPTTAYGSTNLTLVVDVGELNSAPTSGTLTVKLTKDAKVSLSFPPDATTIGGRMVQNNVWSFTSSDPNYYVLATTQPVAAGDKLSFGLTGVLSPGATTGQVSFSVILLPTGMTEARVNNNSDADKIEYFQQ